MDVDFLTDDPLDDVKWPNQPLEVTPRFLHWLPYRSITQVEYDALLVRALENLSRSVQTEQWGTNLMEWCQYLKYLFALKYPMSLALRARMARLFYELAVMPKLDASLTEMAATICVHLLSPKQQISIKDLELPWKPLYHVLEHAVRHKQRRIGSSSIAGVLLDLAECCQRFFPASEASAMLEAMLPNLDGHDLNSVISVQALLVHFLPLSKPDEWLPALFQLWATFKSSLFDDQMLDLLARLTELHVTEPHSTSKWSETGIFSDEQFALIMTKCLRSAGLPVGVNKTANAALMAQSASVRAGADATASQKTLRMKKPSDRLHSFALILVYSIAFDDPNVSSFGGSKALAHLAQFVQATEMYFHPSNWGPWQEQLATFVQHLTWTFARRVKAEQQDDCRTPAEWRITPRIQEEFVRILRTICLLSLFSKDPVTSLSTQSSLKRMAFLQPELILPAILQRSYNSLEALETTQRTGVVIAVLATTSQPMLSRSLYAAGAKHLAPLLHLCLPGIDMNDSMKTMSTCMFILSASISLVISDASMNMDDYDDETLIRVDDESVSTLSAEDYAARLSTADLDAWSTEFIRRVLALFAALPEEGKGGKIGEKNEEAVLNMLIATCDAFCSSLGEEAFLRCFDLVLDYVRTTTAANGVKVVGSLIGCFARANSSVVLQHIIPLSCERIKAELEHGASSIRTTTTSVPCPQDTTLHWHINVLSNAIMFSGSALLPYRQEILSIMALLIDNCRSERAYVLNGKFVQRVLTALVHTYPSEQRCVNPDEWDSDVRRFHSHRLFGRLYTQDQVTVSWHVPSKDEVDMAVEILEKVISPVLDRLDALFASSSLTHDEVWHNDVCRYLHVVRYALAGQVDLASDAYYRQSVVPTEDMDDMDDVDPSTRVPPIDMGQGMAAITPSDPRFTCVMAFRERVGTLLQRVSEVVLTLSADHVDAMKQVVRALRTYLVPHSAHTEEVQGLAKSVAFFRTIGRRWAKQQRFPRILWIRRAMLYHVTRQRLQYLYLGRTACDNALILWLERLCTSHYVPVRRIAQTTLESVCTMYRGTRWLCLPSLLEHLSPTASDEQVKGALYVLAAKSFQRTIVRNLRFTRPVLRALFCLQSRSRPSIQKLVRSILSDLASKLVDPAMFKAYFPLPSLHDVASTFMTVPQRTETPRMAWLQKANASVAALQRDMLELLKSPKTHWAFAQLAMRVLRAVLSRDQPVQPAIAEHVARLAISDDPGMRLHAQTTLVHILYLSKLQSFTDGIDLYLERMHQPLKHCEPTQYTDAPEKRAAMFHAPLSSTSHLHDRPVEGWLVWPAYDTYYTIGPLPPLPLETKQTLDAIARVVNTDAWWQAFVRHMSLEMERDYMAADTTTLVKSLFQMLGSTPLTYAKPYIEQLVNDRDRHKHRAAAELTGGIVRGAKHWAPDVAQEALHAWLGSWLPRVMCDCTLDSQPAWQMWVEYVFQQRDPRRLYALLTFLWDHSKDALSAKGQHLGPGQQAHAMQLLASAVHALQAKSHGWDEGNKLADALFSHFAHDYQEVRKAVCETLVEWEWTWLRPSLKSVPELLAHSRSAHGSLLAHSDVMRQRCEALQKQLRSWRAQRQPLAYGTSKYDVIASTGALWVCLCLDDHRLGPMSTYVLSLVPDLFEAFQLRDNEELSETAHDVLVQVASHPFSVAQVPVLLEALLHILRRSESWHSRLDALPLLQIVYFQNLYLLSHDMKLCILDVLCSLLHDPHVEVRDMAATTLAGIVRCSQRAHITKLSQTFADMAAVPIPRRGSPGYEAAMTQVHAGVLGACALVAAFPYDVPSWMPSLVLDTIAVHSESPVPISTTVRRCAADFRRTHQDTWAEDQHKFGDRVQEVHDFTVGRSDYFA